MKRTGSEQMWTLTLLKSSWTMALLEHGTQELSRRSLLFWYLGLMGTIVAVDLEERSVSADQATGAIEDRLSWDSQVSPIYSDAIETWTQSRTKGSCVQA